MQRPQPPALAAAIPASSSALLITHSFLTTSKPPSRPQATATLRFRTGAGATAAAAWQTQRSTAAQTARAPPSAWARPSLISTAQLRLRSSAKTAAAARPISCTKRQVSAAALVLVMMGGLCHMPACLDTCTAPTTVIKPAGCGHMQVQTHIYRSTSFPFAAAFARACCSGFRPAQLHWLLQGRHHPRPAVPPS